MIVPYGYELIQIMAYPAGFQYRFRFDEEWVSENVKSKLSSLDGHKGYIVFRDKLSAKLYPVRHFTLIEAQKIGKIYYFVYELNEIIDFETQEAARIKQIDEFNAKFSEFHQHEINNVPTADMKPLVLLSNFEPDIKNKHSASVDQLKIENERWTNVISSVKDIDLYENVEFIKIVDVTSMKDQPEKAQIGKNSLIVKEARDYKLRLLQYNPKKGKENTAPTDIKLKSDGKYINIIRDQQRAVGKYDILTFIFRVNSDSGGNSSFLDIELAPKHEVMSHMDPKLYMQITIQRSYLKSSVKIGLGILFACLFLTLHIHPESHLAFLKDVALVGAAVVITELLEEIKGFLKRK